MTSAVQERENVLTEIHTALRHMAVYGFGNMLVRVLGFFMIPFYTHYLVPKDYGIMEILDLSMALLGLILNMGLTPALLRSYAAAQSPQDKRRVVSTACLFGIVSGTATFLAGFALNRPVGGWLFQSVPSNFVLLSFGTLILNYMSSPSRTYLRALDKAGTFTISDTIAAFLMLIMNIVFIAVFKLGVLGVLLSSIIVAAAQFVLISGWAFYRTGFGFVWGQLHSMLKFGAPLIFGNLGLFVLNFSDRFFLQHFRSLDVVGIYALGYKFGYMLNMLLVQPFLVMWQARMYSVHAQPDHQKIFRQIFALYSLGLIYAGLAMSLFSPEVVRVMVEPKFASSQSVIPVVVLSYIFYGLSYYAQLGMYLTGRTQAIGVIGAAAAGVNTVLNYFLIQSFGMMGAAAATLLSFVFLAVASYWRSQLLFRLPLEVGRMFAALGVAVALYLLCYWWLVPATAAAVAIKIVITAGYPVLLWKSGILHPSVAATVVTAKNQAAMTAARLRGNLLARVAVNR